ncbi:hypothetical protein GGD65_007897 [Bradyrhizobium sp. CIR18]|nr:hypothetical protein [Bradyrhizobium sp. CIR18]
MTAAAEKPAPKGPGNDLQKVADLLGGPRILLRRITSTSTPTNCCWTDCQALR